MPLEQEVIGMLIGGFAIVMGIAILTTLVLWLKNKNNNNSSGYVWTVSMICLLIGIFSFSRTRKYNRVS